MKMDIKAVCSGALDIFLTMLGVAILGRITFYILTGI